VWGFVGKSFLGQFQRGRAGEEGDRTAPDPFEVAVGVLRETRGKEGGERLLAGRVTERVVVVALAAGVIFGATDSGGRIDDVVDGDEESDGTERVVVVALATGVIFGATDVAADDGRRFEELALLFLVDGVVRSLEGVRRVRDGADGHVGEVDVLAFDL